MATQEFAFTPAGNTVLLIGVGRVGCELAAKCNGAHVRRLLDFDADVLADYDTAEILCLAGDPENTGDMDAETMRQSAEDAAQRLLADIRPGRTLAILLCAIGGQTGSVVLPAFANELKAAQCTVIAVALEPLPFEGGGRTDMAARTVGELENTADLVLVLPNRPLGELFDASLPVGEAVARLKAKTLSAIERIVHAFNCGSCVGLQPSELRRSLTDAGRGALGIGVGRDGDRVEKAIRDACTNSFLTRESCQNASAVVLHLLGNRDLSLKEVHTATEMLGQLVGRVPIQVGLTVDQAAGDDLQATILVTGIRRLNPNALSEEPPVPLAQSQDLSFYDGVNLDIPAFVRRRPVPQLQY